MGHRPHEVHEAKEDSPGTQYATGQGKKTARPQAGSGGAEGGARLAGLLKPKIYSKLKLKL